MAALPHGFHPPEPSSNNDSSPANALGGGPGALAAEADRGVILVVDDDARNRALLRAYLGSRYDVLEAESGPAALELCGRTEAIDLVLLDVMMPGMSGFEVCRGLRAREQKDFLPVILLTALSEQDDRNTGLEAGADDFLAKPVNRQELLLRVKHFLELRRNQQIIARQYETMCELTALKDDLVTLMVHDLRNPLTGVLGLLQVLEAELPEALGRADAVAAREGAEKLKAALDDILQVRQLEEGRLPLVRHPESLEALTEEATATLEGAARMRRLDVLRSIEPGLTVDGDRSLLRRAIENLLSNALKFSPAGQQVRVHGARSGSLVEISVADRGGGVAPAVRERLFQKFGGLAALGGTDRRGYGLGLYFVRLVAEAHGGHVSVADQPGGGTVMTLTLPGTAQRGLV